MLPAEALGAPYPRKENEELSPEKQAILHGIYGSPKPLYNPSVPPAKPDPAYEAYLESKQREMDVAARAQERVMLDRKVANEAEALNDSYLEYLQKMNQQEVLGGYPPQYAQPNTPVDRHGSVKTPNPCGEIDQQGELVDYSEYATPSMAAACER